MTTASASYTGNRTVPPGGRRRCRQVRWSVLHAIRSWPQDEGFAPAGQQLRGLLVRSARSESVHRRVRDEDRYVQAIRNDTGGRARDAPPVAGDPLSARRAPVLSRTPDPGAELGAVEACTAHRAPRRCGNAAEEPG
jgi:hypothetical protein